VHGLPVSLQWPTHWPEEHSFEPLQLAPADNAELQCGGYPKMHTKGALQPALFPEAHVVVHVWFEQRYLSQSLSPQQFPITQLVPHLKSPGKQEVPLHALLLEMQVPLQFQSLALKQAPLQACVRGMHELLQSQSVPPHWT
jgi:hypothetical protein